MYMILDFLCDIYNLLIIIINELNNESIILLNNLGGYSFEDNY